MCFREETQILLQAEVLSAQGSAREKIKEGTPFCAIRGDHFNKLTLPSYHILSRTNNTTRDYRMVRKIIARGHIKAKKRSSIKEFRIIYLDFFSEHESKEEILEPNTMTEMIGRSITMLIIPENCQVSLPVRGFLTFYCSNIQFSFF